MSSFEFLSVLISVVVGLGIANILTGVGRLLHFKDTQRISLAVIAWTAFLFLYMVIYWWTVVFGWQEWQNWNLLVFLFVLIYGILLFLLTVILFPTDVGADWDPHQNLIEMRHWFYGVFLAVIVVEFLDSVFKSHLDDFALPYVLLLVLWAVCGVVGFISQDRKIHGIVGLSTNVSQVAWVSYQLRDLEWALS